MVWWSRHEWSASLTTLTVLCIISPIDAGWKPHYWTGTKEPIDGQDVIVPTQSGSLRGKRRDWDPQAGGYVRQVDWFLGIPYAQPPVGELRFKPTRPVRPWKGVRNATKFGSVCPQRDDFHQIPSDEDCLTLNIYTPAKEWRVEQLPVMVYIHGGSYRVGTGASYLGHLLAQRGVVVVTINYRLCILGFISARHKIMPGNNGLLDQIQALSWVKDNIRTFGGNPNKVTIFGNSAGGASVGILTVSPRAKGLFQQTIVQSGSPMSFWALHNDTVDLDEHVRNVAGVFQCANASLTAIVACLRTVPADFLGQCTTRSIPSISASNTNFRPHVDGDIIPRPIRQLYDDNVINVDVLMTGVVQREWSQHIGMMMPELMWGKDVTFDNEMDDGMNRSSFVTAINHIFCDKFGWGDSFAKVVMQEYTNWTHIEDPVANRETYINFMTDFGMVAPTVELATAVHRRDIPVYAYQFNHKSSMDRAQWSSNAHLVELHYIFGAPFLGYEMIYGYQKNFSEADKDMSIYMMDLWAHFAKHGKPSASVSWESYEAESSNYFSIWQNHSLMSKHLKPSGVSFWNDVIPTLQRDILGSEFTGGSGLSGQGVIVWVMGALCIFMALTIAVLALFLYKIRQTSVANNQSVSV